MRGDRMLAELAASPDVRDQLEIESMYLDGGRTIRRVILDDAVGLGPDAPLDLLRLAIHGMDAELARIARGALMQSTRPEAADLIVKALDAPMTPVERSALLAALDHLGEQSPRARTLAAVQRGLSDGSGAVDVAGWAETPAGGAAHLDLAESFLSQAYGQLRSDEGFARYLFMDALATARKAEALGTAGWRVGAAVAIASYYLDDKPSAYARAEAAVADGDVQDAAGWNAMAVLAIFAQGRQQAIQDAVQAKVDWPSQWLADVDAAYDVLARHPYGTVEQIVAHYDFLNWLGAGRASGRVLRLGLERFPASSVLHARLRTRVLWRSGVERLESTYEEMLSQPGASPDLHWYAGLASLTAASRCSRACRRRR